MAFPDAMVPRAVIEIVNGPAVVSPPISGQKYCSEIENRSLENAFSQASFTLGKAIARVNASGFAPMAARSERLTARALWPNSSGLALAKKCLPSTSISLVTAISSLFCGFSMAQSSPIPSVMV